MGRMTTVATRSLEMAVEGFTPNRRISIGSHERTPAGAGDSDQEPNDSAPQDDVGIHLNGHLRVNLLAVSPRGSAQVPTPQRDWRRPYLWGRGLDVGRVRVGWIRRISGWRQQKDRADGGAGTRSWWTRCRLDGSSKSHT
jgi:hypothetical protein